jgi:predicted DNA-binding transcriptional regulator AlpA
MQTTPADSRAVLWAADLARRYGKAQTTIWRWKQAGHLPEPDVRIADKVGWYLTTIEAHERYTAAAPEHAA